MTINIDELTGNETLDELEAALDGLDDGDNADEQHSNDAADPKEKGEPTAPPAAEGEDNSKASDTNQEEDKQQESEKVLLSKDGKHIIPYDVLEAERAQRQALAEENAQLKAAASEREKLQKVLEKHGIDPNADPDALDVEEIEQLAEDYPEIGKVLTGIANRLNKLQQPQTQQPAQQQPHSAPNDVQAALQAVPVLKGWMESDVDRRTFAVDVDDRLREDPAWKDKPLADRFAEVVKRTKAAFGDPVDPPAKEQKQPPAADIKGKDVDNIPRSPSDIGQSVQHSTEREKFDGMTDDQLHERMSGMTPEQIEALLLEYDV